MKNLLQQIKLWLTKNIYFPRSEEPKGETWLTILSRPPSPSPCCPINRNQGNTTCTRLQGVHQTWPSNFSPGTKNWLWWLVHCWFHWTLGLVFCLQYFLFTHTCTDLGRGEVQSQLLFKWQYSGRVLYIQVVSTRSNHLEREPGAGSQGESLCTTL